MRAFHGAALSASVAIGELTEDHAHRVSPGVNNNLMKAVTEGHGKPPRNYSALPRKVGQVSTSVQSASFCLYRSITWYKHLASCIWCLLLFSRLVVSNSFAILWTVTRQAPLSMAFPRQGYWSGLPLPSPGDLPDPGDQTCISCTGGRLFTTEAPAKRHIWCFEFSEDTAVKTLDRVQF